mmetsp:Transcript_14168/g.25679  ORF Transcript_14168/g.25679 Transcript_14168/m.25679 type:complete len:99 (-) Transcript_14168:1491-1787(-)
MFLVSVGVDIVARSYSLKPGEEAILTSGIICFKFPGSNLNLSDNVGVDRDEDLRSAGAYFLLDDRHDFVGNIRLADKFGRGMFEEVEWIGGSLGGCFP